MFKVFINNYYEHIHVRYISHDCNFEDINQLIFFFDFLHCREKVHDNKKFNRGSSKPRRKSRITSR